MFLRQVAEVLPPRLRAFASSWRWRHVTQTNMAPYLHLPSIGQSEWPLSIVSPAPRLASSAWDLSPDSTETWLRWGHYGCGHREQVRVRHPREGGSALQDPCRERPCAPTPPPSTSDTDSSPDPQSSALREGSNEGGSC